MSGVTLLPCPKCGRVDQVTYAPDGHNLIFIGCVRCQNAIDGFATHGEAFTAWNALITPPAPAQPALFTVVTP